MAINGSEPSKLVFKVTRSVPELVPPAGPTPHEFKDLSDIDDQEGLRFQIPLIFFYNGNNRRRDDDPAKVIKAAVGAALVAYYPLAGRLREKPGRKLAVECTGEGVLFVEADADVALEEFSEEDLRPPVPCLEELIFDVPGSVGVLHTPLLHFQVLMSFSSSGISYTVVSHRSRDRFLEAANQACKKKCTPGFPSPMGWWTHWTFLEIGGLVGGPTYHCKKKMWWTKITRLKCGGFILVVRMNHCIIDAMGFWQFLNAVSELARGVQLSVKPVWERHRLSARHPPRITRLHHEHNDDAYPNLAIIPPENLVHRTFFFGAKEMSALWRLVPPHLKSSSTTFDVLSACLWRCRTIALEPGPEEVVHFIAVVNVRSKLNPPLSKGYYGNALAYPAALCTANELYQNSLGYAIELIKKAKAEVDDEYMRSLADLLVIKGRPRVIITPYSFQISDVTKISLDQIDYGWGVPVYGGTSRRVTCFASFYVKCKRKNGEKGIAFPISLPALAMDRFVKQLHFVLAQFPGNSDNGSKTSLLLPSSM